MKMREKQRQRLRHKPLRKPRRLVKTISKSRKHLNPTLTGFKCRTALIFLSKTLLTGPCIVPKVRLQENKRFETSICFTNYSKSIHYNCIFLCFKAVSSSTGYFFGQTYNMEYNSDDEEKYYKRSVLDKKRRRAMQIMSVNEKERIDASENCPLTSNQKVGSAKKVFQSRKENSRGRRNVDDFICGDDEIEYERDSERAERDGSSR